MESAYAELPAGFCATTFVSTLARQIASPTTKRVSSIKPHYSSSQSIILSCFLKLKTSDQDTLRTNNHITPKKSTNMSSKTSKRPQPPPHDDLDNYDIGDLSDDPFASPSPPSKKRKPSPSSNAKPGNTSLGIDEEVSVAKRVRAPTVKLDEDRLLSAAGIPKLRSRAQRLKLKGKGHEWSDAERLLNFYQNWLDDLYPKARFVDALGMVEKMGHKRKLTAARAEWIEEGRRRVLGTGVQGEDEMMPISAVEGVNGRKDGEAETRGDGARPTTPPAGDVPDDADLYGATPRRVGRTVPVVNEPDDDDLDALIAEAEGPDAPRKKSPVRDEPEGDDLDALMAEAESHDAGNKGSAASKGHTEDDFAAEEAAMQEMDGLW